MWNLNLLADVWSWLVPVVIIVVYLISHLWSVAQGPQQQKQQQNQQRRRRQPGERLLPPQQATVPGAPPSSQTQLNAEIEQFLRRANQRRAEKGRREGAPPKEAPTDVQPIERRDFDSVSASVLKHMGSGDFEQRAEHMGDDVKRSEAELEQHLKHDFEHRMGSLVASDLGDQEIPVPEVKPPAAAEDRAAAAKAIAGMLVNQQNIRQAVVMKEILERPVDRW